MLCSWCDAEARYHLVSESVSHRGTDAACDEHEAMWGRLYRRSVALRRSTEVDLRDSRDVDLRDRARRGTVA